MTRAWMRWSLLVSVVTALLAGAWGIVKSNEAAMAGVSEGRPGGFYGH